MGGGHRNLSFGYKKPEISKQRVGFCATRWAAGQPLAEGASTWSGSYEFTATPCSITLFRPTLPGLLEGCVYNNAGARIAAVVLP